HQGSHKVLPARRGIFGTGKKGNSLRFSQWPKIVSNKIANTATSAVFAGARFFLSCKKSMRTWVSACRHGKLALADLPVRIRRPFMKKLLAVFVALVLATGGLTPADVRIFTRPLPPSRDVLQRLSLTQAWTLRIPVLGQRDGLFSVQLLPAKAGMQLIVQTFSGAVILLDAETGDTLWRTTVGDPFAEGQPVGYNSSSIFTTRQDNLYILNRANGRQRVWTLGKITERVNYGFILQHAPSAKPVADEENIFFCL